MRNNTRRPRKYFENKLADVIRRVERQRSEHSVTWSPRMRCEHPSRCGGTFEVTGIYVFGSFARGAEECGDLDLIVEVQKTDGFVPPDSVVKGATTGHIRDADVLIQWQDQPRLIDEMEDRTERLIWSPTDTDWRSKIAEIPVGQDEGRFDRRIDRLPPALDRVRGDVEQAEQLADDIENGVYSSEWVQLDSIVDDGAPGPWDKQASVRRAFRGAGRKTTELLPRLIQFVCLRSRTEPHLRRLGPRAANEFRLGGYHIHVGSPCLQLDLIDDADTGFLILAPHIRKNSENGLWVIGRGSAHPAAQAFADVSLWTIAVGGRISVSFVRDKEPSPRGREEKMMGLFSSKDEALEQIAVYLENDDGEGAVEGWEAVRLCGNELLTVISEFDVVWYGGRGEVEELRLRDLSAVEVAEFLRGQGKGSSRLDEGRR